MKEGGGHTVPYNPDYEFYSQLPGVKETTEYVPRINSPQVHHYPADVWVTLGTALLSSATVAKIIHAWLQSRRRTITIEVSKSGKKVVYKGPNIRQDTAAIQAMIDKLSDESDENGLEISAVNISEEIKPALEKPKPLEQKP